MDAMDAQIAAYQKEKEAKEQFLKETLEYNQYDQDHFSVYMEYKKGKCDEWLTDEDDGSNLDNWTMQELEQVAYDYHQDYYADQ